MEISPEYAIQVYRLFFLFDLCLFCLLGDKESKGPELVYRWCKLFFLCLLGLAFPFADTGDDPMQLGIWAFNGAIRQE